MMLGYLVAAIAVIAIGWLAHGVWRIGAISRGAQIDDRAGTALLLVDLQSVIWDEGPYSDSVKATAQEVIADHVVIKRVQDAFETGELDALFAKLDVGQLRIVGLDLNYCVQKTALAAKGRGYGVTIIKDGTLAAAPTQRTDQRMAADGIMLRTSSGLSGT